MIRMVVILLAMADCCFVCLVLVLAMWNFKENDGLMEGVWVLTGVGDCVWHDVCNCEYVMEYRI